MTISSKVMMKMLKLNIKSTTRVLISQTLKGSIPPQTARREEMSKLKTRKLRLLEKFPMEMTLISNQA